jgi:hypothetical protein
MTRGIRLAGRMGEISKNIFDSPLFITIPFPKMTFALHSGLATYYVAGT